MIKFFRKIRQNLLMENKTGKYLKYAIGEILLVVIGILIALSINNWNEKRKDNVLKQTFLLKLKSNLQDDISKFKEVGETNERYLMHIDSALTIVNNHESYNTADLQRHLKFLNRSSRFNTNRIAFDNILSIGKVNIIENESITEKLFSYYIKVEDEKEAVTEGMDAYNRNTFGPALLEFDFTSSSKFKTKALSEYIESPFIINSLELKKQMITYFNKQTDNLLSNALEIRKLVSEELKK
jgi:hypothetical protein